MQLKRSVAFLLPFPCVFTTPEVGNDLSYKLEVVSGQNFGKKFVFEEARSKEVDRRIFSEQLDKT